MQVPSGWKTVKVKDISNVTSSKRILQSEYQDYGVPFYRSKEIILKSKNHSVNSSIHIPTNRFLELKSKFGAPQKGDILITAVGTIGVTYLVKEGEEFYFKDGNLIWLNQFNNDVNPILVKHYFSSEQFMKVLEDVSAGSSQSALTIEKLSEVSLPLPPLDEQKRIAEILSAIDESIEATEKQINKLKDLKKATMQELLTKGIGHTEFKDSPLGKIPKSWEVVKLEKVCTKIQDGNYGAEYPKKTDFIDIGIPFLTSKVIGGHGTINPLRFDYISIEQHRKLTKAQLKGGEVLFTNRGANVGQVAYYNTRFGEGNIGPQLTLLRHDSQMIICNFLLYSMVGPHVQKQVRDQDSGSAMNFFGVNATREFLLAYPPLEEQEQIADILSSIDSNIENKQSKLSRLKDQKKALMNDLLTGKVRV